MARPQRLPRRPSVDLRRDPDARTEDAPRPGTVSAEVRPGTANRVRGPQDGSAGHRPVCVTHPPRVVDHQMMPMRTADDAVQLQAPRCCFGMPEKLPIVATHRQGPNDLFRLGIVDRNAWVAEVHGQCRPLVPQITQRFADPAAGHAPLRRIAVQPASHAVPDRHRFAPVQLVACGGVQRLAPLFDIIQLPVERNRDARTGWFDSAWMNSRRACILQLA